MNILVLTPFFPSPSNTTWGNFVFEQSSALARLHHQLDVLLLRPAMPRWLARHDQIWSLATSPPAHYTWQGISVHAPACLGLPRYLLWQYAGWMRYISIRRLVQRLHKERAFDVVHGHGLIAGDAANRVGARLQVPSVTTVHGVEHAAEATLARKQAMRRIFREADATIIVGSPLRPWVEQYCDPGKVVTAPNGINPDWRCQQAPEELARAKENKLVVLSVGRLDNGKGIEETLRAVALLDENIRAKLKYWIVGDGHLRPKLESLCCELGLKGMVTFWGTVDHARVNAYYAACDIFALPAWQEAFGMVYLEAMLHGKPVVGCWNQGAAEIIRDNDTGILTAPKDIGQLRDALARLTEDEALCHSMGARGHAQVMQAFTAEHSARHLLDVYRGAIEGWRTQSSQRLKDVVS